MAHPSVQLVKDDFSTRITIGESISTVVDSTDSTLKCSRHIKLCDSKCAHRCFGRRNRTRQLFWIVFIMLFILSVLPFIYLTLLTTSFANSDTSSFEPDVEVPKTAQHRPSPPLQTHRSQQLQSKTEPSAQNVGAPYVGNNVGESLNFKQQTVINEISYGDTSVPEHLQNERQKAVVSACRHAWDGYKKYAWGKDELRPVSRRSSTWFDLGLTLIDSLDTLWIMGMEHEFVEATEWVRNSFTADVSKEVNLFETTIRVLGGLLSAYNLSSQTVFLEHAVDLGHRLLPAFNSKSPIPFSDVNLHSKVGKTPKWGPDSSTSEVTSIQLEFKELTRLTNISLFHEKVSLVSEHVKSLVDDKVNGLVPYFINANSGRFRGGTLTLGARADSYYEYLLKQYIQTNYTQPQFKSEFEIAVKGITSLLTRQTPNSHLTIVGELTNRHTFSPKMDHLVCFYPGTLALATIHGFESKQLYLELAANITRTCYEMYRVQPTGLAPEISHFRMEKNSQDNTQERGEEQPQKGKENSDLFVKPLDKHYLLRPETVESLFYMYRITGDKMYQDWGWNIFEAIEKYTKVKGGGYSSIGNVLEPLSVQMRDKMESFFIGETLKYLFLLFDDSKNVLPLDQYVFNTEAHPLPIYTPKYSHHTHTPTEKQPPIP